MALVVALAVLVEYLILAQDLQHAVGHEPVRSHARPSESRQQSAQAERCCTHVLDGVARLQANMVGSRAARDNDLEGLVRRDGRQLDVDLGTASQ